jgi:hypothetical protein
MNDVSMAIECDSDVADELEAELVSESRASVYRATKSSLDGSPETVLQIIQLAITAGAALPAVLTSLLDRRKIRKFKLGDIEIENPTPEQCDRLWHDYLQRSDASG